MNLKRLWLALGFGLLLMGGKVVAQDYPIEIVPSTREGGSEAHPSANGQFVVFASGNGAVLWDVNRHRLLRRFWGLRSIAFVSAISLDGTLAAAGGYDHRLCVWDVATGRVVTCFDSELDSVKGIRFSRDGRRIIYIGDPPSAKSVFSGGRMRSVGVKPLMYVRDLRTGATIGSYVKSDGRPNARTLDISPRGDLIAVGTEGDGAILLFNSEGRLIRSTRAHQSKKSFSSVTALAFSPDGSLLASGGDDQTAKIWEVSSGKLVRVLPGHIGQLDIVQSVTWAPNAKVLVSLDSQTLRAWDVGTGSLKASKTYKMMPGGDPEYLTSVAYSPVGDWVLLNGTEKLDPVSFEKENDRTPGVFARIVTGPDYVSGPILLAKSNPRSLYAFDLDSGASHKVFEDSDVAGTWFSVVGSADAKRILATENGVNNTTKLWYLNLGASSPIKLLKELPEALDKVCAISRDGRTAAFADHKGNLTLIDLATGLETASFKGPKTYDIQNKASHISFSPDNKSVAVFWGSSDVVQAFNIVSSGSGIRLRPVSGTAKTQTLGGETSYSPDGGSILLPGTSFSGYTIQLRSAADLSLTRSLELRGEEHFVSTAAFSSDGAAVIAGGFDSLLRRWDLNTGAVSGLFKGHTTPLNEVMFAAHDRRVVSEGNDGIKVWDAQTGELLISHYLASDGSWVSVTPEGFFDSSENGASLLIAVRGLESLSIDQFYQSLYRPDLVREKLAGDPNGKVKSAAAQLDLDKVMASGVAPKVAITSPDTGSSAPIDEVAVEATITEQGGGVGKVEWRVNGVTLALESRGLDRIDAASSAAGSARPQSVKRTLALEPGDNRIEVVAYNAKGLIASEPAQVTVRWDGAKTASPPKLYVLAVGVNDYYDSRLHLAYAVPDATALADGFGKAGAGLYASVEVKTVLDSDVTAANLDKVFAELSTKVQPRDVFVFFLAGHGKTENGRYYFLPRDFRYEDESSIKKAGMGQDKFQAWFAEVPARKSLLLYDTCESGSLTGAARGSDIDERLGALNRMARATGRTFLTATTDDAPALEGFHGHGVFTYALLDALGHADVNKDGLIEISELADYVDQKVPDYSFEAFRLRQIPQRSIVGNNFALANKAEVLAATVGAGMTQPNKIVPGSSQATPAAASDKPTHVVIGPADVYAQPAEHGAKMQQLPPGTLLSLVRTEQGWALVVRDGQQLGYVAEDRLMRVQ